MTLERLGPRNTGRAKIHSWVPKNDTDLIRPRMTCARPGMDRASAPPDFRVAYLLFFPILQASAPDVARPHPDRIKYNDQCPTDARHRYSRISTATPIPEELSPHEATAMPTSSPESPRPTEPHPAPHPWGCRRLRATATTPTRSGRSSATSPSPSRTSCGRPAPTAPATTSTGDSSLPRHDPRRCGTSSGRAPCIPTTCGAANKMQLNEATGHNNMGSDPGV